MKNKPNFWKRLGRATKYAFNYNPIQYATGYDATKTSRYRQAKRYDNVRSEETELPQGDRLSLIALLLDHRRNNPIVKSICRLREEDTIGRGIIPRVQSGDKYLDQDIEDAWEDYSNYCEISGLHMTEVQRLLASQTLIHGDGGLLKLDTGEVQLISGEQIGKDTNRPYGTGINNGEPFVQEGVEIDEYGRPTAYHIGQLKDGRLEDSTRVSADEFIIHMKRMRAGQLRGVPELATSVDTLMDIKEYDQTEMIAAKVAATLSAVVKRQDSLDFELGNKTTDDERLEHFEPGRFTYLDPGEDISVISANGRPNVDAIEWITYKLRCVGSTIGIPTEFLLMTIGQTSFSASQGMILLYQNTIEAEQRCVSYTLNQWYRWWLTKNNVDGTFKWGDDLNPYSVKWQPPAFRWVNRASQVKSDQAYLQMGGCTLENITSQFGATPKEILTTKAKEIKLAKDLAEEYELDDWRELFNPIPTTASAGMQLNEPEIEAEEEPEVEDEEPEVVDNETNSNDDDINDE
jgi:lambda family phage portal protein